MVLGMGNWITCCRLDDALHIQMENQSLDKILGTLEKINCKNSNPDYLKYLRRFRNMADNKVIGGILCELLLVYLTKPV